jgi:alpha-ketoglutarate-dependent taurine dioxygenase
MPAVGGDTLWASAYEAYDRLSPAYQSFLEGLTATHIGQHFVDLAARNDKITMREQRGSPENVGQGLEATHPIVRTNPVTGWKGLFVNREFTKHVNGLTKGESDALLEFLFDHISSVSLTLLHYTKVVLIVEPRSTSSIQMGSKLISYLG